MRRILIIAGSDSGGGAGIQGDIKTVSALGGYAMTAITAITAQNTKGVFGIHPIPDDMIVQQIQLCLDDIGADAIKTGMLHSASAIDAIATALPINVPLVVDPVMVAKGGAMLIEPEALQALRMRLIPLATLLTPNLPEAETLLARKIDSTNTADVTAAGRALLALGPKAVLLKGGHSEGATLTDMLVTADAEPQLFTADRLDTRHTHGTGCALASAIATGLAQEMPLADAIARAHAYVQAAIRRAPGFGAGNGPLGF